LLRNLKNLLEFYGKIWFNIKHRELNVWMITKRAKIMR